MAVCLQSISSLSISMFKSRKNCTAPIKNLNAYPLSILIFSSFTMHSEKEIFCPVFWLCTYLKILSISSFVGNILNNFFSNQLIDNMFKWVTIHGTQIKKCMAEYFAPFQLHLLGKSTNQFLPKVIRTNNIFSFLISKFEGIRWGRNLTFWFFLLGSFPHARTYLMGYSTAARSVSLDSN